MNAKNMPSLLVLTRVTASHHRHFVVQGESLEGRVGFTVPQHHVEVALLMLRLRSCQSHVDPPLALFLVLHLHFFLQTFWGCVLKKLHCVIVHAGRFEVPLHLLFAGEVSGVFGCEEVCV